MGPQLVFDLRLLESRLQAILELSDRLVTLDDVFNDVERVLNLTRAMRHGHESALREIQQDPTGDRFSPKLSVGSDDGAECG